MWPPGSSFFSMLSLMQESQDGQPGSVEKTESSLPSPWSCYSSHSLSSCLPPPRLPSPGLVTRDGLRRRSTFLVVGGDTMVMPRVGLRSPENREPGHLESQPRARASSLSSGRQVAAPTGLGRASAAGARGAVANFLQLAFPPPSRPRASDPPPGDCGGSPDPGAAEAQAHRLAPGAN
ncbi:uncharacterized protein LOC117013695 [Rhinolophus ferrumequinum]|uniref:uncharacterized protein LOC117013695 n=1 Tax=Rhinolophus ferrumequinum TaxID=59479 RepID=UPI00140FCB7A|nr:uncharacterized protein LOC117013695 [Rhinolophus ferrumequinum]